MLTWHRSPLALNLSNLSTTTAGSFAADHSGPCLPPKVSKLSVTDSEALFRKLARLPQVVFFDSAQLHDQRGRYSYIGVDPFEMLTVPVDTPGTLAQLDRCLLPWRAASVEGLPSWQGGAAGMLSYDIGRSLERLPKPQWDEFKLPALAVGLYDLAVLIDHQTNQAWAVSHGMPEIDPTRRQQRAEQRLEWLLEQIESVPEETPKQAVSVITRDELAPSFEERGVLSNFSREGYLVAVEKVIEHLRVGDAFQVNLAQRLLLPAPIDPVEHYLKLRRRNAAPFGGYFNVGDWQILSASPERFLHLENNQVETRPIKGTRPRGTTPDEDCRLGEILTSSEKDRAENVMIVDLMRNDLSRVCTDASVRVPKLFGLERYAHVQHLVSVVQGELRVDCGAIDLLSATLPGGSITGAPKIRAQEIIAELEPTARGAYCGSLFCLGFADAEGRQAMDSNLLIRTLTCAGGWMQAPVGGGITIASDPEAEYEETWHKAAGLIEPEASSR